MIIIIDFNKVKDLKYSKQRELILKTLQEYAIHPTADVLYAKIKTKAPEISLATVYRNLNLLAENGVIKKIEGLDNAAHFDHNMHRHYHLLCTECQQVFDIPADVLPMIDKNVAQKTGMMIESYDISFRGICPKCQNTNSKQEK